MKRKILFIIAMAVIFTCIFAISVSAKAIYKDTDGNVLLELEFYTADDNMVKSEYTSKYVVKSYTEYNGGLALYDKDNNPLTWYLVSSDNYSSGNVTHTVASFKTIGEPDDAPIRGQLSGGKYSYVGINSRRIVSVCFPDDAGISNFNFSYGGYNSHNQDNLLFFYGPNTITAINEDFFQETPVIIAELDEEAPIAKFGKKICHEARNLRTFTVPSTVKSFCGDSQNQGATFFNCISLTDVVFGENSVLEKVGNSEFLNCFKLANITLPQSLTYIGGAVFGNCNSLRHMVVPDNVTTIGQDAFTNTPFTNNPFTENSKLTSIHKNVFYNTAIEEITIPRGITSWPLMNSNTCPKLKKVILLPESKVTTIPDNAFYGATTLVDISIPDTIVSIGNNAFKGTGIIESPLSKSSQCTSIGISCFEGCASLKGINIPVGITYIADRAFSGCKSLEEVCFDESSCIDIIGAQAFEGCSSLKSISLPNTVTTLVGRTFLGCSGLTSIALPNSLTTMGVRIFQGCSNLKSISFGAGFSSFVSDNDHFSFTYQANVEEVYLPASFTAESLPTTGKITYIFTNSKMKFYYAGTQEQFDGIVERLKGVEGNGAFNTIPTVENGRLVLVNTCDTFYNGQHIETETVAYKNGYGNLGEYCSYCSQCQRQQNMTLDAIIVALGYSYGIYNEDRTMITSGFIVNTDLVELYEEVNGVDMETGVMFTNSTVVSESAPSSMENIIHIKDGGMVIRVYEYKITFPNENDEKYEMYASFEFVVSAFINVNDTYSFVQGNGGV